MVNGNVLVALLLLGYLVAFCVYIVVDVSEECRRHTEIVEHEEHLDSLWDDEAVATQPQAGR